MRRREPEGASQVYSIIILLLQAVFQSQKKSFVCQKGLPRATCRPALFIPKPRRCQGLPWI